MVKKQRLANMKQVYGKVSSMCKLKSSTHVQAHRMETGLVGLKKQMCSRHCRICLWVILATRNHTNYCINLFASKFRVKSLLAWEGELLPFCLRVLKVITGFNHRSLITEKCDHSLHFVSGKDKGKEKKFMLI